MKISNQTATQINQILDELIKRYSPGTDPCSMTDLSFQVNQETGELIVLDDRDDEIVGMTIDEWIANIRVELKKNVIKKQNRDINNREIYSYLHDIFGAEVLDLFDIEYDDPMVLDNGKRD